MNRQPQYQQALRDVQNTQSNPRKLHQEVLSTIEDAKQIKVEMLAVLKIFKQEMRSILSKWHMQFGQKEFSVQQQPFPFPNYMEDNLIQHDSLKKQIPNF